MGFTTCRGMNGTVHGYLHHQHHGTAPCIGCVTAWRQYQARNQPNRAAGLHSWPLCGAEHPYTPAGYTWHQATGTKPCIGCETAHNETQKRTRITEEPTRCGVCGDWTLNHHCNTCQRKKTSHD